MMRRWSGNCSELPMPGQTGLWTGSGFASGGCRGRRHRHIRLGSIPSEPEGRDGFPQRMADDRRVPGDIVSLPANGCSGRPAGHAKVLMVLVGTVAGSSRLQNILAVYKGTCLLHTKNGRGWQGWPKHRDDDLCAWQHVASDGCPPTAPNHFGNPSVRS
jgi:hypothetical protein